MRRQLTAMPSGASSSAAPVVSRSSAALETPYTRSPRMGSTAAADSPRDRAPGPVDRPGEVARRGAGRPRGAGDVGTRLGEGDGERAADASTRAGNEDDLAGEVHEDPI